MVLAAITKECVSAPDQAVDDTDVPLSYRPAFRDVSQACAKQAEVHELHAAPFILWMMWQNSKCRRDGYNKQVVGWFAMRFFHGIFRAVVPADSTSNRARSLLNRRVLRGNEADIVHGGVRKRDYVVCLMSIHRETGIIAT